MRVAVLRVKSVGCESCVAPSKELLLRARGVKSVKVVGSRLEVTYDDTVASLAEILERSGVSKFYTVEVESDEKA